MKLKPLLVPASKKNTRTLKLFILISFAIGVTLILLA